MLKPLWTTEDPKERSCWVKSSAINQAVQEVKRTRNEIGFGSSWNGCRSIHHHHHQHHQLSIRHHVQRLYRDHHNTAIRTWQSLHHYRLPTIRSRHREATIRLRPTQAPLRLLTRAIHSNHHHLMGTNMGQECGIRTRLVVDQCMAILIILWYILIKHPFRRHQTKESIFQLLHNKLMFSTISLVSTCHKATYLLHHRLDHHPALWWITGI